MVACHAVAETYVTVPIASYHFDRGQGYNELNLGFGLERELNDRWRLGAGYFRNSNRDDSLFVGATYAPWSLYGAQFGMALGVVTGYDDRILPLAVPTAIWETHGGVGLNIVLIPPADGKPGALGFQMKWRLD